MRNKTIDKKISSVLEWKFENKLQSNVRNSEESVLDRLMIMLSKLLLLGKPHSECRDYKQRQGVWALTEQLI